MAREYRHIKMYEKEIFELKEQGLSQRQIADKFGISYEKIHNFFKRHNRNQRKLAAGIEIKPKGRPRKEGKESPPSVQQLGKLRRVISVRNNPSKSISYYIAIISFGNVDGVFRII